MPHPEYLRLCESNEVLQTGYLGLFKYQLSESSITEIKEVTNKAWVLGNDRFKQRIQEQLGRRVEPKASSGTENLKSLMPIATYQYFELKSDRVIWMSITRSRRTTAIGHIADVGWE